MKFCTLKYKLNLSDGEMRYPVDVDIIHDGRRKVTQKRDDVPEGTLS
ncbi:MAG: hypothetical protein PUC02_05725 [Bacteroidales bacterium]|nr:hypothetical protein [Bacteroidales bacterium]